MLTSSRLMLPRGMKKILSQLKGKVVEIRMDVTCKTLFNDIISANEYNTNR